MAEEIYITETDIDPPVVPDVLALNKIFQDFGHASEVLGTDIVPIQRGLRPDVETPIYRYYTIDELAAYIGQSGVAWGQITGVLSDQTDLQAALNLKANLSGASLTGATVNGVTLSTAAGTSNFLRGDGTYAAIPTSGGTVTSLSVVSANGFAGSVATPSTTPAITLSTSVTGLLKGNGTAISAATSGSDYSAGTAGLATGILKSTSITGALTIAVAADFPTLNQNTTGSAATLTTGRTISITGDLAYSSPAFDGSANVTAAGTLATVNSNVGSFTNATITVNAKGLITAASSGTAPVTGPGSATDNAIALFNGTTGKIIKNSGATVDGSGNLTATNFTGSSAGTNTGDQEFQTNGTPNTDQTLLNLIEGTNITLTPDGAGGVTIDATGGGGGSVISVTGTADRITSTGGTTPVIDIAATYVGQASITTLGTIATGVWQGTKVGLAYGGTNADLSATGGASQVLRQSSTGAAITVGQLAASDLSDGTTGSGSVVLATSPTLVTPVLGTPSSGNLANCTFPTLNQNTTGSAAKWTTARDLAGNSVDGSANVAFANKFIVQGTTDAGLSAAQFLGALGTGIVKNTITTGVLSIAVAGDFPTLNQNTTGSAATLTTPRTIGGVNFDGSAAIVPQTIESANEATDTTCFLLFITASGTQQLQPKNNTALTYNSNTGALGATSFSGAGTGLTGTAASLTAGAVTNATFTTALTVDTGTVTIHGNAANTSALTIGAGAVSVSGSNTGDQTITLTGAVTGSGTGSFATTIATPGTLTVSSSNSTTTAHTHAITSSSAPGAAASILATDSSGIIGSTGTRIVKGWFVDLTVTNAIAASITGSAPTLTTARAIYGNNFDGSAALSQIIASTYGGTGNGFTKFSGPATSEKTFTLPDASATILTSNAAVTPAQGGTGLATLTANAVMLGNGTSNVGFATIGTAGRLLIDQGAAANPAFTAMSQDATISSSGVITVTKTNNVAFAASATTDATNAANISSGTLPGARQGVVGGTYLGDAVTVAQTIVLVQYAPYAFTINTMKNLGTVSGTVTGTLNINGTPVTGLSSLALTSTPAASTSASGANTVAAGDKITFVTSSASSLTGLLAFSLIVTRT